MSEKIIEVSGLQKSYKENHVLKDVSFTIDKGSIFALLGSNGAGKTTVIKILSTLLKADGGSAVRPGPVPLAWDTPAFRRQRYSAGGTVPG